MSTHPAPVGVSAMNILKSNYDCLKPLLDAPDEFYMRDLPDFVAKIQNRLLLTGVLVKEGRERIEYDEGKGYRYRYSVNPAFLRTLEAYDPIGPQLPCTHHGFSNLGAGEYTCNADWCDARFDRETVRGCLE